MKRNQTHPCEILESNAVVGGGRDWRKGGQKQKKTRNEGRKIQGELQ